MAAESIALLFSAKAHSSSSSSSSSSCPKTTIKNNLNENVDDWGIVSLHKSNLWLYIDDK